MLSSPMVLSFASVFALLGFALIIVAVCTDNWTELQVNRREIINAFNREPELNVRLKDAFTRNLLYFTRNYGLFQICFSDAVPSEIGSYSKFGSPCIDNPDYLPAEATQAGFSSNQTLRLYLLRASALLYIIGVFFVAISLLVGIFGCWRRSQKIILTTSLMLLFAVLFLAAAMACWHYVSYLERYVLDVAPYYKAWEPILKSTSRYNYGWSYIVSWAGVAFILISAIFMLISYKAIKEEEEMAINAKHGAYMMPSYYDKGGAMVPYGYNTYGGYGAAYPYGTAYPPQSYNNGYYGYMTYGR